MKRLIINNTKLAVIVASLSLLNSCGKLEDFGDTNVNPNGASEPLTGALLTNAESQIGGYASILQPGFYCQYFAEPTYPGASRYTLPQINSAANYSGPLMDLQLIINRNNDLATANSSSVIVAGSNANQIATAMVLKAYIYWTLTDRWGDMPYSEALKGPANLYPKYDSQEEVYFGIINDLKVAIATFDELTATVKNDIIFSGNIAKWKKTANSLRMLIALRMSRKHPSVSGLAAIEFQSAYDHGAGFIETNDDNFTVNYPGGNFRCPWYSIGGSSDNGVAKTFTDALNGLNDTRLTQMATANTNGVPYGLTAAYPQTPAFARILVLERRQENSPVVVVSAANVLLAIAEAIELGWIVGDAEEFYKDGVAASFQQWGVALPAGYLTTGPANYNSGEGVSTIGGNTVLGSTAKTDNKLQRIALQQWIAYYPDGLQGWSNWRKSESLVTVPVSGIPDLKPTVNALNDGGQIVRRYVYGISEYSLNGDKLKTAVDNIPGGDDQDSRVWWDRN